MPAASTKPRRTQQERSDATTGKLLAAARALFAEAGYAATSLDQIAAAASVTKGALYHHFEGKRDIFRAVYELEQARLSDLALAAYGRKRDPWDAFEAGCRAFLEASLDPGVQRITLLDAPGALGWEEMRELESHSFDMMVAGLGHAMDAGRVPRRPAEPLAYLLFGALCEAAMAIARADDPEASLKTMLRELRRLLGALGTP